MLRLMSVLPRSLVGRVMLLYMATLSLVVTVGFGIFVRYEAGSAIDDAEQGAQAMSALLAPAVSEAAVIGDYDTIKRTLERTIAHPLFERAAFIDLKGARLEVGRQDPTDIHPPDWLTRLVAQRLDVVNTAITIGGRDYGITRLSVWHQRIATDIWQVIRMATAMALAGLLAGMALVWWPLRHWLGQLDRIQALGAQLQQGGATAIEPMRTDAAPLEFQRTFEVLNRVAASLQTERAQAAVTLASIAEGVATLNRAGEIVLANPVMATLLGQTRASLLDQPLAALLPELGFRATPGEQWQGRRIQRAGGPVLEASLAQIKSETGEPAGWVLALRDVSEQQALEDRLRGELDARSQAMQSMSALLGSAGASAGEGSDIARLSGQVGELVARLRSQADELRAIFSLSPDGFASFDASGRVRYLSPAFAPLTALTDLEVLGQDEAGLQTLLDARRSENEREQPLRLAELNTDPRLVHLERPHKRVLALALHRGGSGEVSQLLHVRDVSQQFEVDRLKSEFLTTAAHELRTPMTSIFGFAELLAHRELPPQRQRDLLLRIHRQSQAMMTILDELLDLARIEARRAQDFDFAATELTALVRQTVQDFGVPEGREAVSMSLPPTPCWARIDAAKLGQALRNLLSNAYKYSPGGGPVELRLLDSGERLLIEVQDQGIGMSPAELARVSERFYRADRSGAIAGTGLGLALVKEIIELMGGSLQLRSEPGQGSCVGLSLPALRELPGP